MCSIRSASSLYRAPPPPSLLPSLSSLSHSLSLTLSLVLSHSLRLSLPPSHLFNDLRSHLVFPYPSWPRSDKLWVGVKWHRFKHARLKERPHWTGNAVEQSPSRIPFSNKSLQGQSALYMYSHIAILHRMMFMFGLVKGRQHLLYYVIYTYLSSNKGWSQVERALVNLWYPFTINSNQFFNAFQKLHCIKILYRSSRRSHIQLASH